MSHDHDEKDAKGERGQFEAHYSGLHHGASLEQTFGGFYAEWEVQVCWQTWQAARADTARQVAEAVAREREACQEVAQHFKRDHYTVASRIKLAIRARSTQPDAGAPK